MIFTINRNCSANSGYLIILKLLKQFIGVDVTENTMLKHGAPSTIGCKSTTIYRGAHS